MIAAAMAAGITIRFRHDGQLQFNVEQATAKLAEANTNFAETMCLYRALAKKQVTTPVIDKLLLAAFPLPTVREDGSPVSTRRERVVTEVKRLMVEGAGNGGGTAWDFLNGVTEFLDHEGDGKDPVANRVKHFESSLFGHRALTRARAFKAVSDLL